MTALSISFLVLEILILSLACLIGYRRGVGRTAVRLVYLLIIGLIAFLGARAISSSISASAMLIIHDLLPAEIQSILGYSPELEPLVANILSALLAPALFAVLFGLLQLLTLICFKKISTKIVSAVSKKGAASQNKWAGAVFGLIIGFAISAALLSPLYLVLDVIDLIPDRTVTIFSEAYDENGLGDLSNIQLPTTLAAQPTRLSLDIKPRFNSAKFSPWNKPLAKLLTDYKIHEQTEKKAHESLPHSIPLILEMAGDALYSYNSTIYNDGSANDALTNAASIVIPYLEKSDTVKYVATDIIHALGMTFQNGNSFFGLSLPTTENEFAKSMISHLVDALAHTTADTVKDNMVTLFGQPTVDQSTGAIQQNSINTGLLAAMSKIDADDPLSSLEFGDTITLVGAIAENGNMDAMMEDIHDFTTGLIEENGIDLSDRKYESFYTEVKDEISGHISASSEESSITDVAKNIEGTLDDYLTEHKIDLDELQVAVVSVSIAKEFSDEKYKTDGELDISVKDLMNFFGVDESQIPDWAH